VCFVATLLDAALQEDGTRYRHCSAQSGDKIIFSVLETAVDKAGKSWVRLSSKIIFGKFIDPDYIICTKLYT